MAINEQSQRSAEDFQGLDFLSVAQEMADRHQLELATLLKRT